MSDRPESKKAELTAAKDLQAGRDIYISNITQIVNQESMPLSGELPRLNLPIDELVQQVRQNYYHRIQSDCGNMYLLNKQIPIDNLYTYVYILEELPHQHFADISKRVQDFDPTSDDFDRFYLGKVRYERVPGLDIVKEGCKIMCLGAPGSGKTTYLFYAAIQCNQGKLLSDRIPVFIRLIEFADRLREQPQLSLLKHIEQLLCDEGIGYPNAAEILLQQGRVLVLLDGLDEVPQAESKSVLTRIRDFCRTYHKNSLTITCRTNALDYSFGNLGFTEVIVADFDQKQIEIFARKWFTAFARNDIEAGKAKAKQFIEKLQHPENKRIRDLAVTPILLNLTCLVFQDIGNFPSNRAKLYQQGLNILLKEWDSFKGVQREELYGNLSVKNREKLLTYVASVTFTQNRYFFDRAEIEGHINHYLARLCHTKIDKLQQDSEAVLKTIEVQHGLLVERGRTIYSFSHLSFQEYFTAKQFVDNQDLESLAIHIDRKRWREVFMLALGLVNKTDTLLLLMNERLSLILASDPKIQHFLDWIYRKSISVDTPYKQASVRAFYFSLAFAPISSVKLGDLLKLTLSLDREFSHILKQKSESVFDNPSIYPLFLELEFSRSVSFNNVHQYVNLLTGAQKNSWCLSSELYQLLEQLKFKLPNLQLNKEELNKCWETNSKVWADQLRTIMIKHCNIGHHWLFSNEQKELLKQYYDANKLLVDCLDSGCVVNLKVREKIEETLLLPNAEIKRRKYERGASAD